MPAISPGVLLRQSRSLPFPGRFAAAIRRRPHIRYILVGGDTFLRCVPAGDVPARQPPSCLRSVVVRVGIKGAALAGGAAAQPLFKGGRFWCQIRPKSFLIPAIRRSGLSGYPGWGRTKTESGGAYFRSWLSRRPRPLECDPGPATIEITTRNAAAAGWQRGGSGVAAGPGGSRMRDGRRSNRQPWHEPWEQSVWYRVLGRWA